MKKIILTTAFAFLLMFLSSCLTTIHPIFTEKDLVYEPKLIGKWKTKNGIKDNLAVITSLAQETTVVLPGNISSIKHKGYLVSNQNKSGEVESEYIAFLARIGKYLYFDYFPAEKKGNKIGDEFFKSHYVKMHMSYRVDIYNTGFELSQFDMEYVKDLIEENKIRISHETDADGKIVITASTEELQQYIKKYGDEPEAYINEKTTFTK